MKQVIASASSLLQEAPEALSFRAFRRRRVLVLLAFRLFLRSRLLLSLRPPTPKQKSPKRVLAAQLKLASQDAKDQSCLPAQPRTFCSSSCRRSSGACCCSTKQRSTQVAVASARKDSHPYPCGYRCLKKLLESMVAFAASVAFVSPLSPWRLLVAVAVAPAPAGWATGSLPASLNRRASSTRSGEKPLRTLRSHCPRYSHLIPSSGGSGELQRRASAVSVGGALLSILRIVLPPQTTTALEAVAVEQASSRHLQRMQWHEHMHARQDQAQLPLLRRAEEERHV